MNRFGHSLKPSTPSRSFLSEMDQNYRKMRENRRWSTRHPNTLLLKIAKKNCKKVNWIRRGWHPCTFSAPLFMNQSNLIASHTRPSSGLVTICIFLNRPNVSYTLSPYFVSVDFFSQRNVVITCPAVLRAAGMDPKVSSILWSFGNYSLRPVSLLQ